MDISNSPLNFKALKVNQKFLTIAGLIQTLIKFYAKQGIMQVYKILGSIDLIGNPFGLVDKIKTGLKDMVNKPRKGCKEGCMGGAKGCFFG